MKVLYVRYPLLSGIFEIYKYVSILVDIRVVQDKFLLTSGTWQQLSNAPYHILQKHKENILTFTYNLTAPNGHSCQEHVFLNYHHAILKQPGLA